jgi:hypothetical protein
MNTKRQRLLGVDLDMCDGQESTGQNDLCFPQTSYMENTLHNPSCPFSFPIIEVNGEIFKDSMGNENENKTKKIVGP